jgi:hypothetical protein
MLAFKRLEIGVVAQFTAVPWSINVAVLIGESTYQACLLWGLRHHQIQRQPDIVPLILTKVSRFAVA